MLFNIVNQFNYLSLGDIISQGDFGSEIVNGEIELYLKKRNPSNRVQFLYSILGPSER